MLWKKKDYEGAKKCFEGALEQVIRLTRAEPNALAQHIFYSRFQEHSHLVHQFDAGQGRSTIILSLEIRGGPLKHIIIPLLLIFLAIHSAARTNRH